MIFQESKTHVGWTSIILDDDGGLVTSYDIEPEFHGKWNYKLYYTTVDGGRYQRYIGSYAELDEAIKAAEEDHG